MRLRHHDYGAPGAYFVTLCTHRREFVFGEVVDGEMVLNDIGAIVASEWTRTPTIRGEIALDAFVVMPNHLHGIIVRDDDELNRIRIYIADNPAHWPRDEHNAGPASHAEVAR